MKPWLYPGAQIVCVDDSPTDRLGGRELTAGQQYTARWVGEFLPYGYQAPVLCVHTTKTIEALKAAMRDHVANASGGAGIKRRVGA